MKRQKMVSTPMNALTLIYTDDETVHCTVKSFSESALIISYTEDSSIREDYFVK